MKHVIITLVVFLLAAALQAAPASDCAAAA